MADNRFEIIVGHARVSTALNGLGGLVETEVCDAIRKGYAEAFGCTAHDPRGFAGTMAYGKIVRYLRDEYVPKGWTADCLNNFELTVNQTGDLGIVVWGGTMETGTVTGVPTNRNPKGASSRRMAAANQASFADMSAFPRFGAGILDGKTCWVLLHYLDRKKDEIRAELSYALDYSEGHVRNWGPRIILDSIPVEPAPFPEDETDDDSIDIEVARRNEA